MKAVLAQRLLRTVCRHCREKYAPDEDEMEELGLPQSWRQDKKLRLWRPKRHPDGKRVGCAACDYCGYMGRNGIYELLVVDENVCDLILNRAMAFDIRRYARKELGMRTLREEAILKAVKGVTTAEEVLNHTDTFED